MSNSTPMSKAVFWIQIRTDPKLFGLKDPDPKLLISDPDPNPPLFHTILRNIFKNVLKCEKIHYNFIHKYLKNLKSSRFQPIVSSY